MFIVDEKVGQTLGQPPGKITMKRDIKVLFQI